MFGRHWLNVVGWCNLINADDKWVFDGGRRILQRDCQHARFETPKLISKLMLQDSNFKWKIQSYPLSKEGILYLVHPRCSTACRNICNYNRFFSTSILSSHFLVPHFNLGTRNKALTMSRPATFFFHTSENIIIYANLLHWRPWSYWPRFGVSGF